MSPLDTIRSRCEEVGDCWEWQQGCTNTGHPQMSWQGRHLLVRRLAWESAHGEIAAGKVVRMKCMSKLCVNPAHMEAVTRGQLVKLSYRHTRNTEHEYPARVAARIAQGGLKLDFEKARMIRESDEIARVVAAQLGVSESLVNKIRQGRIWREAVRGASVFNQA